VPRRIRRLNHCTVGGTCEPAATPCLCFQAVVFHNSADVLRAGL